MNNILNHIKNHKRQYILASSMVLWFILIVVIAVNKTKVSHTGYESYDNVAFSVFGTTIAWYAIFILTGIVFGAIMAMEEGDLLGIDRDHIYDGLLIAVPLAIVGARLYYVLFDP
ncbi:MAG: prolipoprotein diacylglyceryl transferase, partial [Acholeplasma sp.]|nr:prolipoprotein diacylglyceryl transferase [Acholeplasma sp.]